MPSRSLPSLERVSRRLWRKMLEHYSHIRVEAKRTALDALATKPMAANGEDASVHVTKYVTNEELGGGVNLQSVEKNGGADEARTRDLLRDRQAF
jgi:hypothetical protein